VRPRPFPGEGQDALRIKARGGALFQKHAGSVNRPTPLNDRGAPDHRVSVQLGETTDVGEGERRQDLIGRVEAEARLHTPCGSEKIAMTERDRPG
jgi:hypothetical protein